MHITLPFHTEIIIVEEHQATRNDVFHGNRRYQKLKKEVLEIFETSLIHEIQDAIEITLWWVKQCQLKKDF